MLKCKRASIKQKLFPFRQYLALSLKTTYPDHTRPQYGQSSNGIHNFCSYTHLYKPLITTKETKIRSKSFKI